MPHSCTASLSAFWCEDFPSADKLVDKLQTGLPILRIHNLSQIAETEGHVVLFFLRAELSIGRSLAQGATLEEALAFWRKRSQVLLDIGQRNKGRVWLLELSSVLFDPTPLDPVVLADLASYLVEDLKLWEDITWVVFASAALRNDPSNEPLLSEMRALQSNFISGSDDPCSLEALLGSYKDQAKGQRQYEKLLAMMQDRENALVAELETLANWNTDQGGRFTQVEQHLEASERKLQEAQDLLKCYELELSELRSTNLIKLRKKLHRMFTSVRARLKNYA